MKPIRYHVDILKRLCLDVFRGFGFSRAEAEQITDVLILADLYGITSHGVQRLARYRQSIERGSTRVEAKAEVVFETPVSAVIDGHAGMGQLIAAYAMNKAIEKAGTVGMAFVTVRNSNHFGIAGYYTKMACDRGLMAISVTNSESLMVHTGARQAILGSNPIAFAAPAEPYPFWFDAATTVVPRGKLEVYEKADKSLKSGWTVDENGQNCTDATHVLQCIKNHVGAGGILPVGGREEESGSHKGYGFSMMCELLCAITSGGDTSNHHVRMAGRGAGTCHAFVVIDPAIFGDAEGMKVHLSAFLQELRDAKRADPDTPIYTHGEKELAAEAAHRQNGIEVDPKTYGEMMEICDLLGLDKTAYPCME